MRGMNKSDARIRNFLCGKFISVAPWLRCEDAITLVVRPL